MRGAIFSIVTLLGLLGFGQVELELEEHAYWSVSAESIGNEEFEVTIIADLDDHWHTYSQFMPLGEGPYPTWITFETDENFELLGEAKELDLTVYFDETWEMEVSQFDGKAEFVQKIKRLNPEIDTIRGNVRFTVCSDIDGKCLAPADYNFLINLSTGNEIVEEVVAKTDSASLAIIPDLPNLNLSAPINPDCGEEDTKDKSGWMLFVLGLLGGLVSLVTPCVFPMIPLTVSFFTKGGKDKSGIFKALLYGISIIAVYVSLSIPFYFGADGKILNEIAAGAVLNIAFFVIFLVFAFSFFGYYELTLPSSWANKADKAADMGGFLGIVFMALVLAIVSFSCTGPLLGSVLAGSLTKGPVPITLAMLGFGVGLGLPFTIFAAFPSLLKSLPQSGGWLNSVKVVLGFVEVALAFKFLSVADLVQEWGILKYELFLSIWILCALGTSLYLFGVIKFPHDSPLKKLGIPRIILASGFGVLAIYFALGFRLNDKIHSYQSLDLLSGIAPSVGYSWIYPLECPNGFECYHDFETARQIAVEQNKPLLVDFTGYACTNCRRMEDNVWSQSRVFTLINEDYILVSLYVDAAEELPKNQQGEVAIPVAGGKTKQQKVVTVGNKWSTFEQLKFGKLSQPYYVLLSPDGYLLNNPVGYTPDVEEYAAWLECGLEAYEKLKDGNVSQDELEEIESSANEPVELEEVITATWSYEVNNLGEGEFEVKMIADLAEGYHTYSQFMEVGAGPYPTWLQFDENEYIKIGEASEEGFYTEYDPVWEMDVTQFADQAIFIQNLKVTGELPQTISGKITYQTCDAEKCVLFDEFFEIELK